MLYACGALVRPDNRAVDNLNLGTVAMRNGGQDAVSNARERSRLMLHVARTRVNAPLHAKP